MSSESIAQVADGDGLDQVQDKTRFAGTTAVFLVAPAGHGHDLSKGGCGTLAELHGHLVTVHPGHLQIEQDDLRQERARPFQRKYPLCTTCTSWPKTAVISLPRLSAA